MQNKYFIIAIISALIIASGYIYREFYRPQGVGGVAPTGNIVEIHMRVLKDQWKWDPNIIRVKAGDTVKLHIYNEDTYDHGFAIDKYGVNKRLFPERETYIEFDANVPGEFRFSCSVQCGAGHYDQIGTLIVEERMMQKDDHIDMVH